MKISRTIFVILMVCILLAIFGCDPLYPSGNIRVSNLDPISVGETVEIEIIYPNAGGTVVFGWKDQNIEIIAKEGIISVSGLSVTGLQPGTTNIRISATTVLSEEAIQSGNQERVYSVEMIITVEP